MTTYTIKTVDIDPEDDSYTEWNLGNGRRVTIRCGDEDIHYVRLNGIIYDGAMCGEISKINCAEDAEPFEPACFLDALRHGELNGEYTVYSEAEWNAYVESCEMSPSSK